MGRQRKRKCRYCAELFKADSHVKDRQKTCGSAVCQREHKTAQQRKRRQQDSDYRENDARANREWRAKNKDYWKRRRQKESSMPVRKTKQSDTVKDRRVTSQESESTSSQDDGQFVLQLRARSKIKRSVMKNGEAFEIKIANGQLIILQISGVANEAAINVQCTRTKGINSS